MASYDYLSMKEIIADQLSRVGLSMGGSYLYSQLYSKRKRASGLRYITYVVIESPVIDKDIKISGGCVDSSYVIVFQNCA